MLGVEVSSYPILQVGSDKFASTLAAGCKARKLTALDLTIPEIMSGAVRVGTAVKAFTAVALNDGSYRMVDLAARWMEGMRTSPSDGGLPAQLLVHGGKFTVSDSFDQPRNFPARFKKLWKVEWSHAEGWDRAQSPCPTLRALCSRFGASTSISYSHPRDRPRQSSR